MLHGDEMPKMTKKQKAEEEKYMAEDDLRTMMKSHEIKADPARHKRMLALAKKNMKTMQSMGVEK